VFPASGHGRVGAPAGGAEDDMSALSFDVTEADFEAAVLARSMEVPVLLDCWAPWCGPCRSLGPVLEKLVEAYGGRFLLAKLNTDEAPNISAALRMRSIPLVVLFAGGRPVDQFVGALPEGQIRQFLDKHIPAGDVVDAEAEPAFGPLDEAALLLEEGALDEARAVLDSVPPEARDDQHAKLVARLKLASEAPTGDADAFAARIAANGRDFEARFGLAALHAHAGRFQAAFEQLLDVVLRDKGEHRERARKQLVEWFEVCPDPEVVSNGRRYLGMYLN
jgi:putative thioredoxin